MNLGMSIKRRGPERPPEQTVTSSVRVDLQGVRGIGVSLVVCGHLAQWPRGAFIALDVFFVLSGFFITGLLIDGEARRGTIRFGSFYLARARRLIPVATIVVAATVAAHYLFVNAARGREVADDGLWSVLFWANWHFANQPQDYFATQAESPLVHFWSLAVEEQFYAVWPLWVSIAIAAGSRTRLSPRFVFTVMFAVIAVGGFGYSLWHSQADPAVAYYSTFDRSWEFAAGALVASHRSVWRRVPPWAGRLMTLAAALVLLPSLLLVTPGVAFPAPWALPIVLMTCALLVSGENPSSRPSRVLTSVPLIYLGNISYSLYLWHLPTAVILGYFVERGALYYTLAIALIAVISSASYHLVERPMRYAPWLMLPSDRRRYDQAVTTSQQNRRVGAIVIAGTGTAVLVTALLLPPTVPMTSPATAASGSTPERVEGQPRDARQLELLETALRATAFPAFDPPLDELNLSAWGKDHAAYGCTAVSVDLPQACRFGAGPLEAVVLGDSIAISWMPTIRNALDPVDWTVQQFTLPVCGTWTLDRYWRAPVEDADDAARSPEPYPECSAHHVAFKDYLGTARPDLVFLASGAGQVALAAAEGYADDARRFAEDGITRTIALAQAVGAEVVVLSPPPTGAALERCVTRFSTPSDCITEPDEAWFSQTDGESTAARLNDATYVDTLDWFCVRGECPAFVGETPVLADGGHMTRQYATSLAPLLQRELRKVVRSLHPNGR